MKRAPSMPLWPSVRLKWLAGLRAGDAITAESIAPEGAYPVYGGNGLRGYTDGYTHDGEYVLIGRQGALCGNVNYASGKFWASEHAVVATPRVPLDSRWFGELLRSLNLNQYSVSAAQPGLAVERIADLSVFVPPLPAQQAIGRYLDRETTRIDALIEKKTRFIELLREKRQALITQAVTQGLDPAVPMKDSGVEWLGQVPAHLRVQRLGFHVTVINGFAFASQEFSHDESDCRLLRGINVGVGAVRWDDVVHWRRQDGDGLAAFELAAGDIVFGLDRPWISSGVRVARVLECDVPSLLLQRVAAFRSKDSMSQDFLYHLLSSDLLRAALLPDQTGLSVPHISSNQILQLAVAVPPTKEQQLVCRQLEEDLGHIDDLLAKTTRSIDLLRERRAALITAAVTGQIDLREAA